jgi:hypothetical protein
LIEVPGFGDCIEYLVYKGARGFILRQLNWVQVILFFTLWLTACSSGGGGGLNSDSSQALRFDGTNYYGDYSGTSSTITSTAYPCPNNTLIVQFALNEASGNLTMEFASVGAIAFNDLALNVTRNENVGDRVMIEASGQRNGYNFSVAGDIVVYEKDVHTETFRFTGSLTASNGSGQCQFDFYSDRNF